MSDVDHQKYMQSEQWKAKRQAKLDDCRGKCECEVGCYREATQIHHLHYDTLGNESLQDLQALCPKCHMAKSNVRDFYGTVSSDCCQRFPSDEDEKPKKKILPYSVWHEANFRYQMGRERCTQIAQALGTEPVITALIDNLGIMFACGDIAVTAKITQAIGRFVDVVPAEAAGLDGYGHETVYKLKPEFAKHFSDDED